LTLKHKNAINNESLEINGNEKLSKKNVFMNVKIVTVLRVIKVIIIYIQRD